MDGRILLDAVKFLQSEGHTVEVAEGIHGLFNLDGREVTCVQLIDAATNVAEFNRNGPDRW